jgi:hypothetical protein
VIAGYLLVTGYSYLGKRRDGAATVIYYRNKDRVTGMVHKDSGDDEECELIIKVHDNVRGYAGACEQRL